MNRVLFSFACAALMIDHDRLFKELLTTFFLDFMALFFPDVMAYLEPGSIEFLDKELFTDVTAGAQYETDILVKAQVREELSYFLIHVENQSTAQGDFGERMFRYFARLYEKYHYRIYPVVVFSYDQPYKEAASQFTVEFPEFSVLTFNYRVVQLNRLNWRDFLDQPNPVASALMAKMRIAPEDRPRVKAECLRLLVTLRLDPARMQLISGFVDTYLRLSQEEEELFTEELGRIEPEEMEEAMEIVTSWMERGIEQGRREALEGMILRILARRFGEALPEAVVEQVRGLDGDGLDALDEVFLDFEGLGELVGWLLRDDGRAVALLEGVCGEELEEGLRERIVGLGLAEREALGEVVLGFEGVGELEAWLTHDLEG